MPRWSGRCLKGFSDFRSINSAAERCFESSYQFGLPADSGSTVSAIPSLRNHASVRSRPTSRWVVGSKSKSRRAFEMSRTYILVAAVALAGIIVQGHIGGRLVFLGGAGVAMAAAPTPSDPHEAAGEQHGTQPDLNDSKQERELSSDDHKDAKDDHSQHQHAH